MRWPRLSIRIRLALGLTAGMLFMALAVIGVSYALVARSFGPSEVGPVATRSVNVPSGAQAPNRLPWHVPTVGERSA